MEELIASLPPVISLVVKAQGAPSVPEDTRPLPGHRRTRRRPASPLTVLVDQWFAENTFHSREFERLDELVALKEAQGVTISLGLPALNEEATIGNIIRTIRKALMEDVPLLDEMVLIDSGSVDYTREIAADLGIPVYIHQQILPKYGAYHGKGEALWKSLYVLKGDIVAWIDTDIRNIHPRFVYGLLGPLLRNPRIQYVKGFYRRPLKQGERVIAGGGGRVTELTARPLLNLFFPELSGLIQPLSGEYAGRRQALERLPFFTGYGVEMGLLIDFLEHFGLGAIAQVDLLERIHRNQSLQNLSKMAFAIIQVVIRRLEDRHKIKLMEDINKRMNLIRYEMGRYWLEPQEIHERERPPMITLPEYRAKFARRAPGETA
ncbi:MAG: glucosyl-3-phosphoglycerate synthase [Chloroflexi bacterium]|nr:glucosyl-3-phosphoglycerate synthase [Chloroflexota bacterium]